MVAPIDPESPYGAYIRPYSFYEYMTLAGYQVVLLALSARMMKREGGIENSYIFLDEVTFVEDWWRAIKSSDSIVPSKSIYHIQRDLLISKPSPKKLSHLEHSPSLRTT